MFRTVLGALAIALLLAATPASAQTPTQPLERAHAHNDYEHDRPLFDALDHGFTSVEADVWLVDGELRVAHDRQDVEPGRTLQSLYLDPLAERVRANRGSVYAKWRGRFQLLIDIKSDGPATYAAIHQALRQYPSMITKWTNGNQRDGAVEAVISGNRPRADMLEQRVRYAGYDGRIDDLDGDLPATFMPLVSANWEEQFRWRGVGPMPDAERARLHRIVSTAHDAGYRVRFWATPDSTGPARTAVWRELLVADVDQINTDDLRGLRDFLLDEDPDERPAA